MCTSVSQLSQLMLLGLLVAPPVGVNNDKKYFPHKSLSIIDMNPGPGTIWPLPRVKWGYCIGSFLLLWHSGLALTFCSSSASIPGYNTKLRARPFIFIILGWASCSSVHVVQTLPLCQSSFSRLDQSPPPPPLPTSWDHSHKPPIRVTPQPGHYDKP